MSRTPIGVCLFDAFGTLIYPEPAAPQVYYQWGQRFGDRRSIEQMSSDFQSALRQQFSSAGELSTSDEMEKRRWKSVVQQLFGQLRDWETLFDALWEHFADPSHWGVYADVDDAFNRLAMMGFDLGVASNFDSRLQTICQTLPPLDRIRHLFTSANVGWRKPSRQFFDSVRQSLGCEGKSLWMVGDSRQLDVEPAIGAGWNAILLDRNLPSDVQRLRGDVPSIRSLAELPELLLSN